MAPISKISALVMIAPAIADTTDTWRWHMGIYDDKDCKTYDVDHPYNMAMEASSAVNSQYLSEKAGICKQYGLGLGGAKIYHKTVADYDECETKKDFAWTQYSDSQCTVLTRIQPALQIGHCIDGSGIDGIGRNFAGDDNKGRYFRFACGLFVKGTTSSAWSTTPVGVTALATLIAAGGYLL